MLEIFDRKFIKNLLILAIPVILQNLVSASLNLLDNVMIGHLGVSEIASVGLSNQYYLIFLYSITGISFGAGVFMSQFWGKKDIKNIKRYVGISLVLSLIVGGIYAAIAFFYPESILGLFTDDKSVINLGRGYLKAVALSYIFTCITTAFSVGARSITQTSLAMKASLIGLLFNAILNYIFIFGKFGIEPMGVVGAAVGTTCARFVEMTYILYVIYFKDNILKANLKELLDFNFSTLKVYFKTASSVIFNDIMWIVGVTLYSKIYAILGTGAIATMQIAIITNNVFNIFGTSIAIASSIMIGNNIGAGKSFESIKKDGYKMSQFAIMLGIIIGALFFLIAPKVNMFFNIPDDLARNVTIILRIMAIVLPFRFFGIMQILGTLRGGGDVIYAILTEIVGVWIIGVPVAYFAATYFNLSIIWVYVCVCSEEFFKVAATFPRLVSGKWIRKIV